LTEITHRFQEALHYAVQLHAGDVRKGTSTPYIAHLLSVCALVLEDGGDEEEAIAALLHDALEDHPMDTSREEIRQRFGARVLALVEACTDTPTDYRGGKKPSWRTRKETYLQHLATARPDELRIALADKLHNARATLADYRRIGDDLWKRFTVGKTEQLWYYRMLVDAFMKAGATGRMIQELERIVRELEKMASSNGPSEPRP
jgi:(p)ppGpp synthase/HD superfamily hydrolase